MLGQGGDDHGTGPGIEVEAVVFEDGLRYPIGTVVSIQTGDAIEEPADEAVEELALPDLRSVMVMAFPNKKPPGGGLRRSGFEV